MKTAKEVREIQLDYILSDDEEKEKLIESLINEHLENKIKYTFISVDIYLSDNVIQKLKNLGYSVWLSNGIVYRISWEPIIYDNPTNV